MLTPKDIITSALKEINAIATGEVPTADELQDSFKKLQSMLSSWSLEGLPLVPILAVSESLTLDPGYQLAIETNLAVLLCPMFGKVASGELAKTAGDSKMNIKKAFLKPRFMTSDLMAGRKCPDILAGE